MKLVRGITLFAAAAAALSACGGNGYKKDSTVVDPAFDEIGSGAFIVSVGDSEAPSVGKYYAADDGAALLVLQDASESATQLFRRVSGGDWIAVPAMGGESAVPLLIGSPVPAESLDMASLIGSYVTQVGTDLVATFSIEPDGHLRAGNSACQLTGQLEPGSLPNTLAITLSAQDCADMPSSSTGVLIADQDYDPAVFRMLSDDGQVIADLWVYAEAP